MENIKVTQMTPTNIKEVSTVFMNVFNSVGEKWTERSSLDHVTQNFFGDGHFIAKDGNAIIGFLMSITLIREKGPELFIDSICVLPEYNKKGIGKLLWNEAFTYAKQHELVGIRLLANPRLQSFNWYKSMGYEESGWVELFSEL